MPIVPAPPASDRAQPWRWATLALLLGLVLTALVSRAMFREEEADAQTEFMRLSERIAVETQRRLTLPEYGLKGARGLFNASEDVRLNELQTYLGSINLMQDFPGVLGIGFLENVYREDVDRFAAAVRAETAPVMVVKANGDASDRPGIKYVKALDEHEAMGFNEGGKAKRYATIEQAIASGKPTLTVPVRLLQDQGQPIGFLLLLPVYKKGVVLNSDEDRKRALIGLLSAPIVVEDLVRGIDDYVSGELDIELFAGTDTSEASRVYDDGHNATAAANMPPSSASAANTHRKSRFSTTRALSLGGMAFTLRTTTRPSFDAVHTHQTTVVVVLSGLALSTLMAWGAWMQASWRTHVKVRAQLLTAKLEGLARIVEHTSNIVVMMDRQGRITWVNPAFTQVTGHALPDAIGRTMGELVGTLLTDPAENERLEAGVREGHAVTAEVCNRARDGRTFWMKVDLQPTVNAEGQVIGFMSIDTDITAMKLVEAQLQSARDEATALAAQLEPMAMLARYTTNAVIVADTDRRIRWVNEGFTRLTGYLAEEAIGKSPGLLLHSEHSDPVERGRLRDALNAGQSHQCELRNRDKHGRDYWVETHISPLRSADGQLTGFVAIETDVTERRRNLDELYVAQQQLTQANNALMRTEHFLQQLTDNIPGMIGYWGTDLRNRFANKAYRSWFGLDRGQMKGIRIDELMGPDLYQRNEHHVRGALAGEEQHFQRQMTKPDGSVSHVMANYIPHWVDGVVQGFIVLVTDITPLKQAEMQMGQLNDELAVRAEEAESATRAKSAFLAAMSHEIRTPMNGVVGMAELLTHSALTEDQSQAVRTIVNSGQALLMLIDDILDFSKIEAGRMDLDVAPFDVSELAEGVCSALMPLAIERGVQLTVWVDISLTQKLMGDALRVRQLLNNLIGNAIKFSARKDGLPGRVMVRVSTDDDGIRFGVTDNGIGMSTETVARLFSPFMQAEVSTTRRFGGTGLGLVICKRLVDLMGGRMSVHSEPGMGSEFTFTLPLPTDAEIPRAAPSLTGLRCVLATAADLPAAQLRQWLEAAGADVFEAKTLHDAQQFALAQEAPAVVVRAGSDACDTLALPDAAEGKQRELWVGYGQRESIRTVTPSVIAIDLLRRAHFVRAVGVAAGRQTIEPSVTTHAETWRLDPAAPLPGTSNTQGRLILVAEDDATNRAVLKRQLALLGHTAEFANDGAQALALWRSGQHAMLLTDLHMPELDGYALTRIIREEEQKNGPQAHAGRRLPILALTANAMKSEAEQARKIGIDEYLTKPVSLPVLRSALNAWMPAQAQQPQHADKPVASTPLDVLNLQVLRSLVGDDADVLNELLADFDASAQQHVKELRSAVQASDPRTVSAVAHKLKSSSRSVGAVALGQACETLEAAASAGNKALTPALIEHFELAFAAALTQVQSHLEAVSS